jgi:hypothetical protein
MVVCIKFCPIKRHHDGGTARHTESNPGGQHIRHTQPRIPDQSVDLFNCVFGLQALATRQSKPYGMYSQGGRLKAAENGVGERKNPFHVKVFLGNMGDQLMNPFGM